MKNTGSGKVIGVKIFSKENGHEMRAGVLKQIQILQLKLAKLWLETKWLDDTEIKVLLQKILSRS